MRVRSWYDIHEEIQVENRLSHLVEVSVIALHHPPIVNSILRRNLPEADRLRLSFLHEHGHMQTLPVALIHGAMITSDVRLEQVVVQGF